MVQKVKRSSGKLRSIPSTATPNPNNGVESVHPTPSKVIETETKRGTHIAGRRGHVSTRREEDPSIEQGDRVVTKPADIDVLDAMDTQTLAQERDMVDSDTNPTSDRSKGSGSTKLCRPFSPGSVGSKRSENSRKYASTEKRAPGESDSNANMEDITQGNAQDAEMSDASAESNKESLSRSRSNTPLSCRSIRSAHSHTPSPSHTHSHLNSRSHSESRINSHNHSRTHTPSASASASRSRSRSQSDSRDSQIHPVRPDIALEEPAVFHGFQLKHVLRGHRQAVAAVQFSPDGNLIASCSADATTRIWEAKTGKCQTVLEGHLSGISCLAWGPDSQTIATGSDDKLIRFWNAYSGKAYPRPLRGHHNYIYSITISPKGNILVSGSYDEAVMIWDVRRRACLRTLPAHSDPVSGVDFVRDGTLVVSCGSGDGLIRIWDTNTGQCLRTIVHEDNAPVGAVKFAPNGKFVLAWTLDGAVRLWDYITGRCVKTYQGHQNQKYALSGCWGVYGRMQPDLCAMRTGVAGLTGCRAFLASGSEDGALVFWDVVSKRILGRIEAAHEGVVMGADYVVTNRGARMVSCALDGLVHVWEEKTVADADMPDAQ